MQPPPGNRISRARKIVVTASPDRLGDLLPLDDGRLPGENAHVNNKFEYSNIMINVLDALARAGYCSAVAPAITFPSHQEILPMPLRQRVVEDVARLFGVLAHPTRLRIVTLLHQESQDVSSLRDALGVPAANVSQHLALLRSHHVVSMQRKGTHIHYALRDPRVADIINRSLDILDDEVTQGRALHKAIELLRLRT
jgi:DNA-binding transcriptional ArsR family regulator